MSNISERIFIPRGTRLEDIVFDARTGNYQVWIALNDRTLPAHSPNRLGTTFILSPNGEVKRIHETDHSYEEILVRPATEDK